MKKLYLFLFAFCVLGVANLSAQEATEPRFPGCEDAGTMNDILDCADMKMLQFIFSNLKHPEEAKAAGVGGEVEAKFIVKADGSIADPEVTEGLGHGCDEEVIRLINLMPTWVPGTEEGAPKDMEFYIYVKFQN